MSHQPHISHQPDPLVRPHIIQANTVVTGTRVGTSACQRVWIPHTAITPTDSRLPFTSARCQLPTLPAFAMPTNKSQGQTFDKVGVFFISSPCAPTWPAPVPPHGQPLCPHMASPCVPPWPAPVTPHGQLYVADTRVEEPGGLVAHPPSQRMGEPGRLVAHPPSQGWADHLPEAEQGKNIRYCYFIIIRADLGFALQPVSSSLQSRQRPHPNPRTLDGFTPSVKNGQQM